MLIFMNGIASAITKTKMSHFCIKVKSKIGSLPEIAFAVIRDFFWGDAVWLGQKVFDIRRITKVFN